MRSRRSGRGAGADRREGPRSSTPTRGTITHAAVVPAAVAGSSTGSYGGGSSRSIGWGVTAGSWNAPSHGPKRAPSGRQQLQYAHHSLDRQGGIHLCHRPLVCEGVSMTIRTRNRRLSVVPARPLSVASSRRRSRSAVCVGRRGRSRFVARGTPMGRHARLSLIGVPNSVAVSWGRLTTVRR